MRVGFACAIVLSLLGAGLGAGAAPASPPPDSGRLQLAIKKLAVVGSVLYVAAHPDDENTTLLSYLGNGRLLRATYLSMTRGDGGQNLIGAEQGTALGIIRTQELLAARRIDGAEQLFTRARDFGFSKTPEETLKIWGRDEILADVVWAIRRLRPDVVVTRFPAAPSPGNHGHHTASAQLAEQAFRLAADPEYRPDQLRHVAPWQARRLAWNRSGWSIKPDEDLSSFIKMDIGEYSPLLGMSWGEMAAESRSMHKSQGFGVAPTRGPIAEYFKVIAGPPAKKDVLEGIDVSWRRFAGTEKLMALLARAAASFRPEAPESVVPLLLEADAALDAVPDAPWREQKRAELHDVVAACAGLWAEVSASEAEVVSGGEVKLTAVVMNRSAAALSLKEIRLPAGVVVPVGKALLRHQALTTEKAVTVPVEQPASGPYWLETPPEPGRFRVADQKLVVEPENAPALDARFVVTAGGRELVLSRPLIYRWTDPVAGERTRRVEVLPVVSVTPGSSVLMFPDSRPRPLRVAVRAPGGAVSGTLRLELPPGWKADPATRPFALAAKNAKTDLAFTVMPAAARAAAPGILRAVAEVGGARLSRGVSHIEHPHIPIQLMLSEAEVRLQPVELRRKGSRIGYIPGAGDDVAGSLRQVGYQVTVLGDEELASSPLGAYDAIVVGVRAYNTGGDRMALHRERLMGYVEAGGTLVAQYSTANRISKLAADIGPFPFEIARDRVTDEAAVVGFALPGHRILMQPNRLTGKDFDGWVQERGLYFAGKWDPRYETPLSMNDAGEQPLKGSVLVARHGKGTFVYTGLAFFRQLPAGVPGAFRLFANLIAHGP